MKKPSGLQANHYSGSSPFETSLTIYPNDELSVVDATVDCIGATPPTVVTTSMLEFSLAIAEPGLYECVATVSDGNGLTYTDRIGVSVLDPALLDQQLKAKWTGMLTALENSDAIAAANQFSIHSHEGFKQEFESMQQYLPAVAGKLSAPIHLVEIKENRALYDLRITSKGTEYSLQLEMVKDEDGLWRIRTF